MTCCFVDSGRVDGLAECRGTIVSSVPVLTVYKGGWLVLLFVLECHADSCFTSRGGRSLSWVYSRGTLGGTRTRGGGLGVLGMSRAPRSNTRTAVAGAEAQPRGEVRLADRGSSKK
jgi:hypothetical protein